MPKWELISGLTPGSATGTCVVGAVGDSGLTPDALAQLCRFSWDIADRETICKD